MSFPDPIIPTNEPPHPREESAAAVRAKRRRAARLQMFPADAEGQAALIASLSRRAYPSLELFVFSLVCGAIVGLGFLLDSQAVLLLGILVTPIMTPWVGFLLAIFTGKPRFLFETLMALLISGAIVFIGGLLTGFAARIFDEMTRNNIFIHARLWLPALVVFSLSAILLVVSFAHSEDKPILPSILIAYAFYLPINAGGFGLGSGVEGVFPEGLLVFAAHFALASMLGLLTLFFLKLRPTAAGITMSGFFLLIFAGMLIVLMGGGVSPSPQSAAATPTMLIPSPIPSATSSLTSVPSNTPRPTNTPTPTQTAAEVDGTAPVTESATATVSTSTLTSTFTVTAAPTTMVPSGTPVSGGDIRPSTTPTVSFTPTPLPLLGTVKADEGGGANLRQTPNGKYIMTLENGMVVEIQPDSREVNGIMWAHVFVTVQGRRMEGWLLASVIEYDVTPTPAP